MFFVCSLSYKIGVIYLTHYKDEVAEIGMEMLTFLHRYGQSFKASEFFLIGENLGLDECS